MIKPAVALRGVCILPKMTVQFDISRKKSVAAIEKAMATDQELFVVTQRDIDIDDPKREDLYDVGVVVFIRQIVKMPQGNIRVVVEGEYRASLIEIVSEAPCLEISVDEMSWDEFEDDGDFELEGKARILKQMISEYAEINQNLRDKAKEKLTEIDSLDELMIAVPNEFPMSVEQRQNYLEFDSAEEKYTYLINYLEYEVAIGKLRKKIIEKVSTNIDKNQRDYYLREQLKVIREELGEDMTLTDADEYSEKLAKLKAPKEVKEKIKKEISKLRASIGNHGEAGIARTYLDHMFEMPWSKQSKDNKDIVHAKEVLEEAHYGLDKVKERVLDYLAVRAYSDRSDVPILCLVGPPGTGKTSVAKSVADALNRKYVRVCLGGVRDEAEIRGHRKTYIGAMPGRLANALKQAGVNNPLILLDEIDKTGSDYKGDVSSALLEVLDSEQNKAFRDHYLEVPLDLSNVLFITTANDYNNIPKPLLDRMEVINVESYTDVEKFHIAKKYLIPKQMEKCGLKTGELHISDEAVKRIIHEYTKEAGVRNLERQVAALCHKAVRALLEEKKNCIKVNASNLEKYLGSKKITAHKVTGDEYVGVVNGLAWTSVGGDTMEIEANLMPCGKGLKTTGQLGEVMKESAMVAYTFVKSIAEEYGINPEMFEEKEIHIHVPEGAVPKDGPSAGIALVTAIMSCASGKKVRPYLAMTGEVTIRGRVLPIGGLKEKLLGAKAAGIKEVIVPELNRDVIKELPEEVTRGLIINYVKDAREVLKLALV